MANEQLKEYIAKSLAQGHLESDIRQELNGAGWDIKSVENAMKDAKKSLPVKGPENSSEPPSTFENLSEPISASLEELDEEIEDVLPLGVAADAGEDSEKEPLDEDAGKWSVLVVLATLVLLMFSCSHYVVALLGSFVTIYLDYLIALNPFHFLASFRYIPSIGGIILFSLWFALAFLFLAFKAKSRSKTIWVVAFIISIIAPVFMTIFSQLTFPDISLPAQAAEQEASVSFFTGGFTSVRFVLSVIGIIILLVAFREFKARSSKLSNWPRIGFFVLAIILSIFPVGVTIAGYMRAADYDYGYTDAQEAHSYKIYRTTTSEDKLTAWSVFHPSEDVEGGRDGVLVVYDYPFDKYFDNPDLKQEPIYLLQSFAPKDFDVEAFMKDVAIRESSTEVELEEISLIPTKDVVGYKYEIDDVDSFSGSPVTTTHIGYISPEGTFVWVTSHRMEHDLKNFIRTLE